MKILLALASLAALSAFALSFFRFEVATSLLVGVGFAVIVLNDYARTVRPRGAEMTLAGATAQRRARFRLAA